jgi:hypothetical protein
MPTVVCHRAVHVSCDKTGAGSITELFGSTTGLGSPDATRRRARVVGCGSATPAPQAAAPSARRSLCAAGAPVASPTSGAASELSVATLLLQRHDRDADRR